MSFLWPLDISDAGVLAVIFAATVVRATFGFGKALVAMPLLAMLVGVRTAAPLVALVAMVSGVLIVAESFRQIHFASAWRLVAASAAGVPFGVLLLRGLAEWIMQAVLGAIVLAFAVYSLARPHLRLRRDGVWVYAAGLVAGVLGGAYNTSGPPVVVYGTLRRWPPRHFRATLQGYFFPAGLLVIASHGLGGLWTPAVGRLFVLCLAPVVAATVLGTLLHRRVREDRFAKWVHALLILIAAGLIARSLLAAA